jgi:hypothetical protein
LNGVAIAWKCKKQATATLHSPGSEIVSLTEGVKKTNHISNFLSSIGYPVGEPTPTFEDNQGAIKSSKVSRLHENTHHLATRISWLNEQYTMQYTMGIIKLGVGYHSWIIATKTEQVLLRGGGPDDGSPLYMTSHWLELKWEAYAQGSRRLVYSQDPAE